MSSSLSPLYFRAYKSIKQKTDFSDLSNELALRGVRADHLAQPSAGLEMITRGIKTNKIEKE
jgi:hypothetical protein